MTTNPDPVRRGHALGDDLDETLAEALHNAATRVLDEPDPATRVIAVTKLLTGLELRIEHELESLRRGGLQQMRYPDGDLTAAPAAGWREIATTVGLTPTRAQQLAGLPPDPDRSRRRAPGAGRKPQPDVISDSRRGPRGGPPA